MSKYRRHERANLSTGPTQWFGGICFLFSLLLGAGTGYGAPVPAFHPLEDIRLAVIGHLERQDLPGEHRIEITAGPLDPRLRLNVCGVPLQTFIPPGQKTVGATTVGVRCTQPSPWTLYVQAAVKLYREVAVAAVPLGRGAVVKAGDVSWRELDVSRISTGYFVSHGDVVGKVVKRSINGGMVLSPSMLEAALAVRRGERVTLQAVGNGFEVAMQGEALADGAEGERIRVRNLSSGREVEGVVVAAGVVQVRF